MTFLTLHSPGDGLNVGSWQKGVFSCIVCLFASILSFFTLKLKKASEFSSVLEINDRHPHGDDLAIRWVVGQLRGFQVYPACREQSFLFSSAPKAFSVLLCWNLWLLFSQTIQIAVNWIFIFMFSSKAQLKEGTPVWVSPCKFLPTAAVHQSAPQYLLASWSSCVKHNQDWLLLTNLT